MGCTKVALDKGIDKLLASDRWRNGAMRRRQAELLARRAHLTSHTERTSWPPLIAFVLGLFFLIGISTSTTLVLFTSPDVPTFRLSFLLTSGLAVWGLVGLAALGMRRDAQRRHLQIAAADALRQGLLAAGCIELNLATRMLDLWTPMLGVVLIAVFVAFEIIMLARRQHFEA